MTKKEEQPKGNNEERGKAKKDLGYNPDITEENKKILNNQSEDEKKGNYLKNRERPIDFEGEDLDLPEMDDKKFNETASKPDNSELTEKPKESANNTEKTTSGSETIYKGEDAEKYKDPSKKKS